MIVDAQYDVVFMVECMMNLFFLYKFIVITTEFSIPKMPNMLFQIDATGTLIFDLMNENREAARPRTLGSLSCINWAGS